MRTTTWIIMGWLGMTLCAAVGSRWTPGYVMPDPILIIAVFLAMRREPIPMAVSVVTLGYLVGRQSAAPTGVHEIALLLCAIWVYRMSGSFGGGGAFFAFVCGLTVVAYHMLVFGLLYVVRGDAAFASWATAALVPSAVATFLLAVLVHHPMEWLESRLKPTRREGLSWH